MAADSNKVHVVNLAFLKPSEGNFRQFEDPVALRDLQQSVSAQGILAPLIVRPSGDGFEIVCGHRRLAVASALKFDEVPCIVRDYSDAEAQEVGMVENLQRETVHPLDECNAFSAMLREAGDMDKLAARVGKSKRYIMQRMKLASLEAPVRKAFVERKMGIETANMFARVSPAMQKEVFKQAQNHGELLNPSRLERNIAEALRELTRAPWSLADVELVPSAGACAVCPKRSGSMQELFPEIKKGDRCTDPKCFDAKLQAFLNLQVAALKGKPYLKLSDSYVYGGDVRNKNILSPGHYQLAEKKNCADMKLGLMVQGESVAKFFNVCVEKSCKIHWGDVATVSDKERAQKKKDREKSAAAKRLEEALTAEIISKSDATTDLYGIASGLIYRMGFDAEKKLCARLNIEPAKTSWGGKDYSKPLHKLIESSKGAELRKLALQMSLACLPLNGFPGLRNVGLRYGISSGQFERAVEKEHAAKKATKKAKSKK